ncbi:hypothetical protein [Variovorax sp. 38R]|uniref:hypothetical protein n=1 Tax=Variovorax sp. 38R TaxID=2774875 RepID=UPI00178538FA|nr:hypothetical protein [Variovorax sp. 38R]QOF76056.1 hypothetical protein IG196_16725 [Variovorax sp. 38R]
MDALVGVVVMVLLDLRTPLLWLLGVGLVAALGVAGIERTRAAVVRADLASEKRERAQEDSDRYRVALTDALRSSEKMAAHAAAQQGLTHALAQEAAARIAAERRNGQLAAGLRDAFAAFAARDRAEAAAHAAGSGDPGDRPGTVDSLFGEAGELLARSADLQEEARSIVTRRDSEVKALKAQVDVDRALVER